MPNSRVDGMDVMKVYEAARECHRQGALGEAAVTCWKSIPIDSVVTRWATRNAIASRKKSRSGRKAIRSVFIENT